MDLQCYFDTKEASRRYDLSESWLAKLRVKGGGPSHIKCGRRVSMKRSPLRTGLKPSGDRTPRRTRADERRLAIQE